MVSLMLMIAAIQMFLEGTPDLGCACAQVREQIAEMEGIPLIVDAMRAWGTSGGVQCNGCLAIVSLVRAESPVCQVCNLAPCAFTSPCQAERLSVHAAIVNACGPTAFTPCRASI